MEDRVNIWEFANGECPYGGCKYNDEGFCINDDFDFLWERITDLVNACKEGEVDYSYFFNCNMLTVEENHCQYCGSKLEKVAIYDYEFWGSPGTSYYECNNCQ